MGWEQPQKLPKNMEEFDDMVAKVYLKGKEDGKRDMRKAIKDFLTTEFYRLKGNERRANLEDPRIQTLNGVMQRLYAKFEEGSL